MAIRQRLLLNLFSLTLFLGFVGVVFGQVAYPFTFPSGFTCSNYISCYDYCATTDSTRSLDDTEVCLLHFADTSSNSGSSSTDTQTPPTFEVNDGPTFPDDGEVNVSPTIRISVDFTDDIKNSTVPGNFSLIENSTNTVISGTFQFGTNEFIFVPSSPLRFGTKYTYSLQTGIQSLAGAQLSQMYTVTFTTESGFETVSPGMVSGFVYSPTGLPVPGIVLSAQKTSGTNITQTTTSDSAGAYSFTLEPSSWKIEPVLSTTSVYSYSENPIAITVESSGQYTASFTLTSSQNTTVNSTVNDSTQETAPETTVETLVSGSLMNANGTHASVDGYIKFRDTRTNTITTSGVIEDGEFSLSISAGNYRVEIVFPPNSSYYYDDNESVSIQAGEQYVLQPVIQTVSSFIAGTLRDENGSPIIGLDARISATDKFGNSYDTAVGLSSGKYAISLHPGEWYLGVDVRSDDYSLRSTQNLKATLSSSQTAVVDISLIRSTGTIAGSVKRSNGANLSGVVVRAVPLSGSDVSETAFTTTTNTSGNFSISVPPGSYSLQTFVSTETGLVQPEPQTIIVVQGESVPVEIVLKPLTRTISGSVMINGIPQTGAFVSAWTSTGGYQETVTDGAGRYLLRVHDNTVWNISAGREYGGYFYRVKDLPLKVSGGDMSFPITLIRQETASQPKVQLVNSAEHAVVEHDDGVVLSAPPRSISSTGSVQVDIRPDVRSQTQGGRKVVGSTYDVTVRTSTGIPITSLQDRVTVTLPYTDIEVVTLGAREENLRLSFWNETADIWEVLEQSIVNTSSNTVSASVDHFTRFAIVAAADIVPPANPNNITATALASGGILLSWVNPSLDFDHIKIYRSIVSGNIGGVYENEVFGSSYTDTATSEGVTYYYTVRAVDPAGNETANTTQVSASSYIGEQFSEITPSNSNLQLLTENLTIGSRGYQVEILQNLLKSEGLYSLGIDGDFGPGTHQAVINFQNKYKSEILTPVGLSSGTGFVGPSTRTKINQLLDSSVQQTTSTTTTSASGLITENLTLGSRGSQVVLLQTVLQGEGLYNMSLDGIFGPGTHQAVINFQNKYKSEILTPVGLSSGTGFVGPSTRDYITLLIGE